MPEQTQRKESAKESKTIDQKVELQKLALCAKEQYRPSDETYAEQITRGRRIRAIPHFSTSFHLAVTAHKGVSNIYFRHCSILDSSGNTIRRIMTFVATENCAFYAINSGQ
jgi:hypothetical protein